MSKKHLALLIPHTDTTLEEDLCAGLGPDWVYHSCRMYLKEVGEEAEKRMVDEALPRALATMRGVIPFDAALFGCTSASAVYGREGLERIHRTMEAALGCPAYSAFAGIRDSIRAIGRPPLALITPYVPQVNEFFVRTLDSFEIPVAYQAGMDILGDPEIAAVPPEEICAFVRDRREEILSSGAGTVLLSCTNLRAVRVRAQVEEMLGLPVVTSNQCLVDWVNRLP